MSGFRCVGANPVELTFEESTFLLGPNGAGKTTFLHALVRMFGSELGIRRFRRGDFHVPLGEEPEAAKARSLWLEADFDFPELTIDGTASPVALTTVPPHFLHMRMNTENSRPAVRFRLEAHLDENGDITDRLVYVLAVDARDEPTRTSIVNRYDRGTIQVHYLPARRDPADHVSYAASSLLGRLMRSADWSTERETVSELGKNISNALAANVAIARVVGDLSGKWRSLHSGSFLTRPGLAFANSEIEGILKYVTLEFAPGPAEQVVDFSLLSDGQQSLLYVALVMTAHAVGRSCLTGATDAFDVNILRPPVFTLLAVEEPENSLSPHYLGRVVSALMEMVQDQDAQVVVATHSASLMRRVEPRQVRHLRLNPQRNTVVSTVTMPEKTTEAYKYIREALHAYPELYFARLVVLGEGDSEEIVLPYCLQAMGLEADLMSISVAPLGGRHVNHFWRLLNELDIPHVTLIDLDLGRDSAGWGRIRYAAKQLLEYRKPGTLDFELADIENLHKSSTDVRGVDGRAWIERLEKYGVFFSEPMDLDFSMVHCFSEAYEVTSGEKHEPDEKLVASVLGDNGSAEGYTTDEKLLFPVYSKRFKGGSSKPARHIAAMSKLDEADLKGSMPAPIQRLVGRVAEMLEGLPE